MAIRPKGKQSVENNAEQKAGASLRKRGTVWWEHFGFKGLFFRRSLGTSDRSEAKIEAKKLIALAEAVKIQTTASSPDERKEQMRAWAKKSFADPKVSAKVTRANRKSWADFSRTPRKIEAL